MISILFLLFSITLSFVEYRLLKNNSELFQERITELIINTVSKITFGLIFFNFVPISIWHYMRKNDFISSEILHEIDLFNYIGLDFLILSIIIFVLPILPITSKDILEKISGYIFLGLIILSIIYSLAKNTSIIFPRLTLYASIALYCWGYWDYIKKFSDIKTKLNSTTGQKDTTTKNNSRIASVKIVGSNIILVLLIIVPSFNLEKMTENTLQQMKLGGFKVKLKTDDKQIIEGFLLLKTTSFYYITPINNGKIKNNVVQIIHTGNTTLTYEKTPEQKKEGKVSHAKKNRP